MLSSKYNIWSAFVLLTILVVSSSYASASPSTPEKLLPAGVDAVIATNPYTGEKGDLRKGTIGSTIANIAILNKLFEKPDSSQETALNIQATINEIRRLIPSLKVSGIFNLFNPEDWLKMSEPQQWGRVVCALLYFEKYPAELNKHSKDMIISLKSNTQSKIITQLIEQVLSTSK